MIKESYGLAEGLVYQEEAALERCRLAGVCCYVKKKEKIWLECRIYVGIKISQSPFF